MDGDICRRLFICMPLFTAKAYATPSHEWGSCVMYEWRYIHILVLRLKTKLWRFLRDKLQRPAQFAELQVDMSGIQVHKSDCQGEPLSHFREHLVSTKALLALVILTISGRSVAPGTKESGYSLLQTLVGLSKITFQRLGQAATLSCPCADPWSGDLQQLALSVSLDGVVDLAPVLQLYPVLEEIWDWCSNNGEAKLQSPLQSAALVDVMKLCVIHRLGCRGAPKNARLQRFLVGPLLAAVIQVVAYGCERHFCEVYKPGSDEYRLLKGAKKQCRVDPLVDLHILNKVDSIHGGGAAISELISGDRHRLGRLKHGYNVLYMEKAKDTFKGHNHFHVAADPSQYSGEPTQVCVCFSWTARKAAVLPIKAPAAAQALASQA
jgi:hypothetical protein